MLYIHYRQIYRTLTQPTFLLGEWESEADLAILPTRPIVHWHKDEIKITEIPLMVVEIVSPRQAQQDIMDKIERYFKTGVKSCWLINPLTETVYVYTPDWKRGIFSEANPKIHDTILDVTIDFQAVFS